MNPAKFLETWGPKGWAYDKDTGIIAMSEEQFAAAIREAVEQEREACLMECAAEAERLRSVNDLSGELRTAADAIDDVAHAIRARSATSPSDTVES